MKHRMRLRWFLPLAGCLFCLSCAKAQTESQKKPADEQKDAVAAEKAPQTESSAPTPSDLPDVPTEEDFAEQVAEELPEGTDLAAELDVLQKEISGAE